MHQGFISHRAGPTLGRRMVVAGLLILAMVGTLSAAEDAPAPRGVVIQWDGRVEVSRAGAVTWDMAYTNQLLFPEDQLRTAEGARAVLRMADETLVRVGELSQIQMPADPRTRSSLGFIRGIFYFFHRGEPSDYELRSRTVTAIVRGTEFTVEVAEADGTTLVSMFDGRVEMTNEFGGLQLQSGQQGLAEPNRAPVLTPVLTIAEPRLVQWSLYYPGILYWPELGLSPEESAMLRTSIEAWQAGDLIAAYLQWPAGYRPAFDEARVFRAATRLGVGQVDAAEADLAGLSGGGAAGRDGEASVDSNAARLAEALSRVIELVRSRSPGVALTQAGTAASRKAGARLATEWLVDSLEQQKGRALPEALHSARKAVEQAPAFAFGWARVAELEFSFGRIEAAREAIERSLQLAPRNAQALALRGFLLAARNRLAEAIASFDQALAIDGSLDNAWLGRGLCYIRQGETRRGREDLQTAVTIHPQRALLRSYLGKAYGNQGEQEKALHELTRSMSLDENDPTAWLYAALIHQQSSRVNEAIRDLEHAQQLNADETRGMVRSRLLLDQDRAVGGANLASVYLDAGMTEVSVREAVTAVNSDYASYRSHLFLANSYNALRDPYQINLRYETAWLSEYLLATLLAPVGAGVLSPQVTQQEYSRLFEQDGIGVASSTEYRSNGDWSQAAAQYGTFGGTSYALDATYLNLNGYRPNQDSEQLTLSARIQQQLTPADSVFLQGIYYEAESGDVRQYYDPGQAHRDLRVKETQEPILLAGYHHAWSEHSHTLALAGGFEDTLTVQDTEQPVLALLRGAPGGDVLAVPTPTLPNAPLHYRSQMDGYTAELQQIWKEGRHTITAGGRYQGGTFDARSALGPTSPTLFANNSATSSVAVVTPGATNRMEEDWQRYSVYSYYHWQILDPVLLTAGLSYDRVEYPGDFRNVPVAPGQEDRDQISPKAGLTWTPLPDTTVRGAYTRSLGGVAFDQSFRLEPSQVAGFNQAYRSLIPESVVGALSAARFDTLGAALDQKLGWGTYVGVVAELLRSDATREVGTVDIAGFPPSFGTSTTRQELDYEERSLMLTLNQLVGRHWAFGASYRLSEAALETDLEAIPDSVSPAARTEEEATLHQVGLYGLFRHPSGFFARLDSIWNAQSNRGYSPDLPGDEFWQWHVQAGWSLLRRRLEVKTGVLNLTDKDYRLNPLNLTPEYPRERTWVASLRFYF